VHGPMQRVQECPRDSGQVSAAALRCCRACGSDAEVLRRCRGGVVGRACFEIVYAKPPGPTGPSSREKKLGDFLVT
jgi:hypothetical protein